MKGSHKQMKEHINKSIEYLENLKANVLNEKVSKSCDSMIEKYKITLKELDEIFMCGGSNGNN